MMTQQEFNQLILFQPDAEPAMSIRDIIENWFLENEGLAEPYFKAYMEEIRAKFVEPGK